MSANDKTMNEQANLARQLRRLAASDANRRYLHKLPLFQVDGDLPDEFDALLKELAVAESGGRRQ